MKLRNTKFLKKLSGFDGKTAIITGASGIIGKQIAVNFLQLGMNVVLPVLWDDESEKLKAELSENFDIKKIQTYPLDLTKTDSINSFVAQMQDKPIHYLINNAGVIGGRAYEVNFKGTLALTIALTPILNKQNNACAVFQSSLSYRGAKINWSDLHANKAKKLKDYAGTKRLLNLAIIALRENYLNKYPNVKYQIAHPGCVISDIMGKLGNFAKALAKPFFHSANTAALSAVVAAIKPVPDNMLVGPKFFGVWGKPKYRKLDKRIFEKNELVKVENLMKEEKLL